MQDCCFLNAYEAIKLVRAARHLVRNVTGYPIWRGLFVDECYDIGRVENVHFWPFGLAYNPDDPYCKWINTQGVAFEATIAPALSAGNSTAAVCKSEGLFFHFSPLTIRKTGLRWGRLVRTSVLVNG